MGFIHKIKKKWIFGINFGIIFIYTLYLLCYNNSFPPRYDVESEENSDFNSSSNVKKWVSLSMCWGNRAEFGGKDHFPYALAGL